MSIIPIAISVIRLVAGPLYLLLGVVPATSRQVVLLTAAALTDLVDGHLARSLHATSSVGAGLDTTADKVFVLAILLKLLLVGRLPAPLFYVMVAQFSVLALEGSIFVYKFGSVPVPDLAAKSAALLAFITVIVGVTLTSPRPLIAMSVLTTLVNTIHLVTAFLRITSETGKLS